MRLLKPYQPLLWRIDIDAFVAAGSTSSTQKPGPLKRSEVSVEPQIQAIVLTMSMEIVRHFISSRNLVASSCQDTARFLVTQSIQFNLG